MRALVAVAAVSLAVFVVALPEVSAGPALSVDMAVAGRDAQGGTMILLIGTGLKKPHNYSLRPQGGSSSVSLIRNPVSNNVLALTPQASSTAPGKYDVLIDGIARAAVDVGVTGDSIAPGSVDQAKLTDGLLAQFGNASALTTGTLDTSRYDAYANLAAKGKIGAGAGQLAAGDHTHDGVYVKPADLAAGSGLQLSGATFSANFAGTGSANFVARSDHNHDAVYLKKSGDAASGTISASVTSGDGVRGVTTSSSAAGVYAENTTSAGAALVANSSGGGYAAVFQNNGAMTSRLSAFGDFLCRDISVTATTVIGVNATSQNDGVSGMTTTGGNNGVSGYNSASSGSGAGVRGQSDSTSGTGVSGSATASSGNCVGVQGSASNSASGIGVLAVSPATGGGGAALVANNTASGLNGDIAVFRSSGSNRARIDKNGQGFFNGGTFTGGADFAESVAVSGGKADLEPGDVLVIDAAGVRQFAKSRTSNSTAVAGVYSTKPGVLAAPYDVADEEKRADRVVSEVPLAITGIVPCKVCDEGGEIKAGDLLVTSSSPGRAMKAPASPVTGTVVGKALAPLSKGEGVIEILVTTR